MSAITWKLEIDNSAVDPKKVVLERNRLVKLHCVLPILYHEVHSNFISHLPGLSVICMEAIYYSVEFNLIVLLERLSIELALFVSEDLEFERVRTFFLI